MRQKRRDGGLARTKRTHETAYKHYNPLYTQRGGVMLYPWYVELSIRVLDCVLVVIWIGAHFKLFADAWRDGAKKQSRTILVDGRPVDFIQK